MRVLVACEYSGVVREAFRAKGHDAWSCDILGSEEQGHHFQCDVFRVIDFGWDMMIAHPPCTYLANSGWHWTVRDKTGERYQKAWNALDFFSKLLYNEIPLICVENPVPGPMLKAQVGAPDQYIQPYMFGDDASKKTGLWLKGLPPLSIPSEDQWVKPRIVDGKKRWANQTDSGQNKLSPSPTRAHERSRTYDGIANAMASKWG